MEASVFSTTLDSIKTAISGNIDVILPVAGALFALFFGIKLIPKMIKKFAK